MIEGKRKSNIKRRLSALFIVLALLVSMVAVAPLVVRADPGSSTQILTLGTNNLVPTGVDGTYLNSLTAAGWAWSVADPRETVMSVAGTFSTLTVGLSVGPGSGGDSITFKIVVNGVASDISVAITNAATTGIDSAHSAAVVAGDEVCISATTANTIANSPRSWWSVKFVTAVDNASIVGSGLAANTSTTRYTSLTGCGSGAGGTTESDFDSYIPTAGTISNLYVVLQDGNPGGGTKAWAFTLRKNGGDTTLTCTISASGTTGNDTSNSVSVAAGDRVCWKCVPANSPTDAVHASIGAEFVSTATNEAILTNDTDVTNQSSTRYAKLSGGQSGWVINEYDAPYYGAQNGMQVKKLYVKLSAAPGTSKSYTFTLRDSAANSALTVTISDSATEGSDTTHTVNLHNYDYIDIRCTPSGTPNSVNVSLNIVTTYLEVAPTVTSAAATIVGATSSCLNGNITSTGSEATDDYRGFVYDTSTHADPGNVAPASSGYASNWTETSTYSTGVFAHFIDGLTLGYTYYFRSCAHNTYGWDYSDTEQSFTTPNPTGTTQLLMGGSDQAVTANKYNSIVGGYQWSASTSGAAAQVMPASGTLKWLYMRLKTAPGGSASYTFTVYKNGGATSLTVTISASATTGADTTNTVSITAGDTVSLYCTSDSSPAATQASWSVAFQGSTIDQTVCLTGGNVMNSTYDFPMMGPKALGNGSNEFYMQAPCPLYGTFKNAYIELTAAPGGSGSYTFKLRKNGANTSLTVTISGSATTGSDTSHSVSVVPGDLLNWEQTHGNDGSEPVASMSCVFVPDASGQSPVMHGYTASPGNNQYMTLVPGYQGENWTGSTNTLVNALQACTLSNLYVRETAGSGVGAITIAKNDVVTTLTAPITASTTTKDIVNSVSVANYDRVNFKGTLTSGSPPHTNMGLAIAGPADIPITTSSAATVVLPTSATLNGNITTTYGASCDYRGFVYDTSSHSDPGNVTPASTAYASNWTETDAYTVGTFNHGITSLTDGYTYYFRACAHNASGWDYSDTEQSFLATLSVSVSPSSYGWGIVGASETPVTGLTYFTLTNNSSVAIDAVIHGHDMTGSGVTWTLSDTATPGDGICGYLAGLEGGSYTIIVKKNTTYNTLKSDLAASGTQKFGLELLSPTANLGSVQVTGTITLTVTEH